VFGSHAAGGMPLAAGGQVITSPRAVAVTGLPCELAACRQHVNPGPKLGDLELCSGKRAVDRHADLGQAGRSVSGFGFLDSTEQLQPGGDVLVVC